MSLFDDASLAMIPSAYKDGKLYSIKPTDGSGDFTFTRGSNLAATRVDVNGLIEKGRENLILQSNQFDTTWRTQNASVTSGQSGYDGSSNAWLFSHSSSTAFLYQPKILSASINTISIYVKKGTSSTIRLDFVTGAFGKGAVCSFDLENGTAGSVTHYGSSSGFLATINTVSNGWYRISLTGVTTAETWYHELTLTSGNIYIQDAQLEVGLVATDYIESTTTTAVSGITEDLPRLDYSGGASCPSLLLEPQRTNVVPHSEYLLGYSKSAGTTITQNYGISPEGVQNSTRIQFSGTDYANFGIATFTNEVTSMYVKGIAGEILRFGKGANVAQGALYTLTGDWQRIVYDVGSASNGFIISNLNGANVTDFEVYGLQHEEGSYPSSYIPTYGAAVTRSGDIASETFSLSSTGCLYISLGEQKDDYFTIFRESFPVAPTRNDIAILYSPTSLKVSHNGSIVINTTGTYDTSSLSTLQLGHNNGLDQLNGIVDSFMIFDTILTDAELNALTA